MTAQTAAKMTKAEAVRLTAGALRYGHYVGTEFGTVQQKCPKCHDQIIGYRSYNYETNKPITAIQSLKSEMVSHLREWCESV